MEAQLSVVSVVFLILASIAFWFAATYNRLVRYRNHASESWSNVDTELKRRHDLIPNLVATVRGYATHEQSLLAEIVRLRSDCQHVASRTHELERLESDLTRKLDRVLLVAEQYPELRADRAFLELQEELALTEDRIQAARRFFNGNIREYNNLVEQFPSNIVANVWSFHSKEFFEIESSSMRHAPKIDLQPPPHAHA